VRVVKVGDFSSELCGGTHMDNTAKIGPFRIESEFSVASGVRRIEAITGKAALDYANGKLAVLKEAAAKLKTSEEEVVAQITKILAEQKAMQQELSKVAEMREKASAQKLIAGMQEIGSVKFVSGVAQAAGMEELREVADLVCSKLTSGLVVLACVNGEKVNLVVKAAKSAVEAGVNAGQIIKEAAKVVGGGGGGRKDMAQAGGKKPEALPKAFEKASEVAKAQILK